MLSGKDITIDKDGIILNGDKHLLASQAEIDVVKGDIDDLGNTVGDITQTGITGATVAAQLEVLGNKTVKTSINPTLESNIAMDHGAITVCNGVCYFAPNFYSSEALTVGNVVTVGQLPNNCIPKVTLKIPCINDTADILGVLMISYQGAITYYPKNTNRFFGYVNTCFEVN